MVQSSTAALGNPDIIGLVLRDDPYMSRNLALVCRSAATAVSEARLLRPSLGDLAAAADAACEPSGADCNPSSAGRASDGNPQLLLNALAELPDSWFGNRRCSVREAHGAHYPWELMLTEALTTRYWRREIAHPKSNPDTLVSMPSLLGLIQRRVRAHIARERLRRAAIEGGPDSRKFRDWVDAINSDVDAAILRSCLVLTGWLDADNADGKKVLSSIEPALTLAIKDQASLRLDLLRVRTDQLGDCSDRWCGWRTDAMLYAAVRYVMNRVAQIFPSTTERELTRQGLSGCFSALVWNYSQFVADQLMRSKIMADVVHEGLAGEIIDAVDGRDKNLSAVFCIVEMLTAAGLELTSQSRRLIERAQLVENQPLVDVLREFVM